MESAVLEHGTDIERTISRPGAVKINVAGAFIVDEGTLTPSFHDENGVVHDSGDIRLPHHTGAVSHVAVDVGDHQHHFAA